jgi:hypothetical protein
MFRLCSKFFFNPQSQSGFLLDYRFIHEHNRYLIANRVDPVTTHAFQAAAIGLQLDFGLTGRTAKDFEKIRIDAHHLKLIVDNWLFDGAITINYQLSIINYQLSTCLTSVRDGLYDAFVEIMSQSNSHRSPYPAIPNQEGVEAFYGPSNRVN